MDGFMGPIVVATAGRLDWVVADSVQHRCLFGSLVWLQLCLSQQGVDLDDCIHDVVWGLPTGWLAVQSHLQIALVFG